MHACKIASGWTRLMNEKIKKCMMFQSRINCLNATVRQIGNIHESFSVLIFFITNKTGTVSPGKVHINTFYKNLERHTVHTIVSWPNPKQWIIVNTSDLMMNFMIYQKHRIQGWSTSGSNWPASIWLKGDFLGSYPQVKQTKYEVCSLT